MKTPNIYLLSFTNLLVWLVKFAAISGMGFVAIYFAMFAVAKFWGV